MFACLHGSGNLAALAFGVPPVVERPAPDTVTLDASGLDRLFGLPQDVAAAIARRAAETGVKANLALASNPDAAICSERGLAGTGLHGLIDFIFIIRFNRFLVDTSNWKANQSSPVL